MSEGLSVGGLASGLDTNAIIDGLVAIERQKITRVETKQKNVNLTLSSWGTLSNNLSTFIRKAESLKNPDTFDKFNITSSNDEIATIEGGDGGMPGQFTVGVYQLARNEKIMSKTYGAPNLALGLAGEFTVNRTKAAEEDDPTGADVTIKIDAGDTLKDIRDKINGSEDIGVSATIVKLSETEYTISLTSKDTGSAGADYIQTVGTVLQDLGILNAAGDKGNVAHKAQSQANTSSGADITADTLFSGIDGAGAGINDTVTISGTDRNGNTVSLRNFIITDPATLKVSDLLSEIERAFNGMVTATVENGRIMVTDKNSGASSLQVQLTANNEGGGSLDFGGLMGVNTAGKNGVLQVGTDAFYSVDGLYLSADSNKADDSVEGITINMKKADLAEQVQVTIDRDLDKVQANVQEMLDSFNVIIKYITEQSKVKVEQKKDETGDSSAKKTTVTKGALAQDSTVSRLKNELTNLISSQFTHLTGTRFTSLASVGIMISQYTGEYEIDSEKFKKALNTDYEGVKNLFVQEGSSEDTSFLYGRSTQNTASGRYLFNVDARTVSLLDKDDNVVKTFAAKLSGGVMTVKEKGEAQDLSVTVPASGSAIVTFSKGVGMEIADYLKKITDKYEGYVSQRQKTIQKDIDNMDEDIAELEAKVERYRMSLVKEFSDLEQTMSRMQSQSANMMSQLGL